MAPLASLIPEEKFELEYLEGNYICTQTLFVFTICISLIWKSSNGN